MPLPRLPFLMCVVPVVMLSSLSPAHADSGDEATLLGLAPVSAPAGEGQSDLDLLGLRTGMTRDEVAAIMAQAMPNPVVIMDRVLPSESDKALMRFSTHWREVGRDVTVYYDGPGAGARVVAVHVGLPADEGTQARFPAVSDAVKAKYADWDVVEQADKYMATVPLQRAKECVPRGGHQGPALIYEDAQRTWVKGAEGDLPPQIGEIVEHYKASEALKAADCPVAFSLRRRDEILAAFLTDMPAAYAAYDAVVPK